MKKISVIIPMYNSENTIEECLDSLIAQTIFNELEIIVIDDKSTDSGPDKVLDYERRYPESILFIRLNSNAGPGNARNIGIDYAHGDYIGYVDSDDAVYPQMYERLYEAAIKSGADYVDGGFYDQKNDKAIVYVSDDLSGRLDDNKRKRLLIAGGYIWSKLYSREFLMANGIRFREEYVLEDMDYLIECTVKANIIANVKEILYVYRDRGDSLSKTAESLKYIHNQSSAMNAIYEKTHDLPDYEGIREAIEFIILKLYSNVLNTCLNMVFLGEQPESAVIPVLTSLKKFKDAAICGNYESEYIKKGISETDIAIIKANDISAKTVLDMQKR